MRTLTWPFDFGYIRAMSGVLGDMANEVIMAPLVDLFRHGNGWILLLPVLIVPIYFQFIRKFGGKSSGATLRSKTFLLPSLLLVLICAGVYFLLPPGALGRHGESVEESDQAASVSPDSAEAWYNKGVSLNKLGKDDEAIGAYDKATSINPAHAGAWYNMGVSLSKLGRDKEAIKAYDRAISIHPDLAQAWSNKGASLSKLGKDKEAIEAYDRATSINPNLAEAWYNKGYALYKSGRTEEAKAAFKKAFELNPNLPPPLM